MNVKFTVDKYPSVGIESRDRVVRTEYVSDISKGVDNTTQFLFYFIADDQYIHFSSESERDKAVSDLRKLMNQTPTQNSSVDFGIMDSIKGFLKEHKNLILWICIASLLDQFILKGAFRERIKNMVESALNKFTPKSN